jgi:hypothetical protein
MGDQFLDAERELAEYFTSAIGVAAQNYDANGGAFDHNALHYRRLAPGHRDALRRHEALAATVRLLSTADHATLAAVYHPHSWPVPLVTAFGVRVGLAVHSAAARKAYEANGRRGIVQWLEDQARRGHEAPKALFRAIVDECTAKHRAALKAYDKHRVARLEAEKGAKAKAAAAREALLVQTLQGRRARPEVLHVAELVEALRGAAE